MSNERPAAHTPAPPDPKREERYDSIRRALQQLHEDDRAAKEATLERLTTFTGKDGQTVQGVSDYRKLSDQRLAILTRTLEAETKKQATPPPADTDEPEPF